MLFYLATGKYITYKYMEMDCKKVTWGASLWIETCVVTLNC
jgi:hypothetical protein